MHNLCSLVTLGLKIRQNITYIVAAIVIQDGKVLLTQEASHTIRGKWYLPCGKMEPNETIAVSLASSSLILTVFSDLLHSLVPGLVLF